MRIVDVDDHVELVAEPSVEVVRDALGRRAVDDTDSALQAAPSQLARIEQGPGHPRSCWWSPRVRHRDVSTLGRRPHQRTEHPVQVGRRALDVEVLALPGA
jgi:HEAT repeat protein